MEQSRGRFHIVCCFVSMVTCGSSRTWRGIRMQWGTLLMTPNSLSACRQPWHSRTWSPSTNLVCDTRDCRRSRRDRDVMQCGRPCHLELAKSFDVRPFPTESSNSKVLMPSQVFSNSLTRRISTFSTTRWNPWSNSSRMSSFRLRRS